MYNCITQQLIPAALAAAISAGAIGCGDTADNASENESEQVTANFALATTVLGDTTTTYVSYLDSLDVDRVDLQQAREYGGYATIGSIDGMLFVADGEAPKITRFTPDADGTLTEDGQLNFSNYLSEAPLYANTFASPTTAYLDMEDSGHVIWNPTEMKIEGTYEESEIQAEVDGLASFRAFRRGSVVRDNLVFQPFHWRDADYYDFSENSKIAVYDSETDELVNMIDAPCPGLDIGTRDAAGNIYFTTWVNAIAAPVIEGEEATHSPCAVRIEAGETSLDTDWTQDLADLTGGRQVAAMRILEGEVAVAAVLDHDRVGDNPQDVTYAANWELWRLNLAEGTGAKIEGTDYIAGGFYAYRLDDRLFVLLPNGDYTSTKVYELPAEGAAEHKFTVDGWVYQMVELN